MVAKMLLLAASASVALASASARTLKQAEGVAFADALQLSRASPDENYSEGTTDAETFGPNDTAYADAEGVAGYYEAESGAGPFAEAVTQADTLATDLDGLVGVPDAQSNAYSQALADGLDSAAEAIADSEAVTVFNIIAGSGEAVSQAVADADDFANAVTTAAAYGTNNADAVADSLAISSEFTKSEAEAAAVAVGGNAESLAVAQSVQSSAGGDDEAYAVASSDAYSLKEVGPDTFIGISGVSNARAFSAAYNDEDAEADATARAVGRDVTGFQVQAATATSRATSRAGGAIPLSLRTCTFC